MLCSRRAVNTELYLWDRLGWPQPALTEMALNANIEAENRKMVKPYKCFQSQGHLEKTSWSSDINVFEIKVT